MADEAEAGRIISTAFWSRRGAGSCKACSVAERLGGTVGSVHPQSSEGARGSGLELLLGLRLQHAREQTKRLIESTLIAFNPYPREKRIKPDVTPMPNPRSSSLMVGKSPCSQPRCWHSRIKLLCSTVWGICSLNSSLLVHFPVGGPASWQGKACIPSYAATSYCLAR